MIRHALSLGSRGGSRSKWGRPSDVRMTYTPGYSRLSYLFCWRPRRDLNPCYRRERAFQSLLRCFVSSCQPLHKSIIFKCLIAILICCLLV
jgi:hypothetical protein